MIDPDPPSLSIVLFVYNEPHWVVRTIKRAEDRLLRSRWQSPEIVVVNDGSTDETGKVLDGLSTAVPLRVIHQSNQGRLLAMRAGINASRGDYVCILGARVLLEEGLDGLIDQIARGKTIWNAHCETAVEGSLLGTFWDALPRIFWSAYFAKPREMSFGIDDFHRYPKGTGGFIVPKSIIVEAFDSQTVSFADPRYANDDTIILEDIARKHRIWISPAYSCRYEPRHSVRRFIPHAFHRGLHFVDGFLRRGNPFAPVIVAFYVLSLALGILGLRRRWIVPTAYAGITLGTVMVGRLKHLTPRHVVSLAVVTPLFLTSYGAGLWVGLGLRLKKRISAVRP